MGSLHGLPTGYTLHIVYSKSCSLNFDLILKEETFSESHLYNITAFKRWRSSQRIWKIMVLMYWVFLRFVSGFLKI